NKKKYNPLYSYYTPDILIITSSFSLLSKVFSNIWTFWICTNSFHHFTHSNKYHRRYNLTYNSSEKNTLKKLCSSESTHFFFRRRNQTINYNTYYNNCHSKPNKTTN